MIFSCYVLGRVSVERPGKTRRRFGSSLCSSHLKSSSLQIPQNVLNSIANQSCFADQARFRLVCNSWKDAHSCQDLSHRVTLQYQPDWEIPAKKIKQVCPSTTVVVVVDNLRVVPKVLGSSVCDKVQYRSPPDAEHFWRLSSHCGTLDRVLQFKDFLNKAQELFNTSDYRQRLELCLSLRSEHAGLPAVQIVIRKLQAIICELHVVDSLAVCATNTFPLHHLRALAFTLPYKPSRGYQAAMVSLPSLEFLHVHANTAKAAACIPSFLKVLPNMQTVSSLRISTLSNFLALPVASLQHVTYLQLGSGVTITKVPAVLRHLRLQALHNDVLWMWPVFQELEQLDRRLAFTLDTFSWALLHLPTNLEELTILQHVEQPSSDHMELSLCHSIFSRLSNLKVLVLADFVTPYISYALKGLIFPHVHTFGFCLASANPNPMHLMDGDSEVFMVFPPTPEVVFPNVQHLRVYSTESNPTKRVRLHCTWMHKHFFTQLQTLTCYYSPSVLTLCDIPSCPIVFKPGIILGS